MAERYGALTIGERSLEAIMEYAAKQKAHHREKKLIEIEANYPKADATPLFIKASEGSLRIGAMEGEVEERGAVLSGQAAGLITRVKPVRELIVDFCGDWEALLRKSYTIGL